MSSSEKNTLNDLLNNDSFIAWVMSNFKTNDGYWSSFEADLNKSEKAVFNKAVDILKKLKTLNIDDYKSNLSEDFIQQQYNKLIDDYNKSVVKKPKVFKLKSLLKYAAVLVLLISIAGLVFVTNQSNKNLADNLVETNYNPSELLLQTPDNKYYVISNVKNESLLDENGVKVNIDTEGISFKFTENSKSVNDAKYKVIVPKDKKYLVTLIDSTNVELNSNTTITFTNSVNTKERHIDLEGEAFFDVTHDEKRPFIVQSSDLKIQVLGTEFNVSNYKANGYTSTTLIDGSINVSNQQGESKIIKPGSQAKLLHNQGHLIVKKVNVQEAVSWTTNRMIFENETLENIIQKINAWYPEKFILNDENIKKYRFTGTLKKQNNLTHFLQMLKYTQGISYQINNDEVTLFFE
ncbi:FecR family protein [Seonamhaeicola sp.]|uniref:FecR family protein n=1 Tax=Seonamhaeicola sp. TaxID=1912245 RepID=UPI003566F089